MMITRFFIFSLALLALSACSTVPEPIVYQPMVAPPPTAHPQKEMNGAIYQSSTYRPAFEDQKARLIGDILTVSISEKTSAGKAVANSNSKSGSASFAAPSILGLSTALTSNLGLSTTSANKLDEKGAETASNTFSGIISVTVIDVLPNGNLIISGEKQIGLNKGSEYVRFSGIVNPQTIAAGNIVASSQVADARFEYRSSTAVDRAEVNSMLNRFFLSFIPL